MLRTKFPALPAYCNRLYKEIRLLEDANDRLRFYTVKHATRVMLSSVLSEHVGKLVSLAGALKRWFDDQDHPTDGSVGTISDITEEIINESNLIDSDANDYLSENEADVRSIINTEELIENVDALEYVLMFSELHKCSSSITLLQGCAVKLLDGIVKDLVVKAQAYILKENDDPSDAWAYRDEFLKKFNAWDEPLKADTPPPPVVYLEFVEHEEQVIFSDDERKAIAEEKQRLETEEREKAILEKEISYAKIYIDELRSLSEKYGLPWHIPSPVSHETCRVVNAIYNGGKELTKACTVAEGIRVLSEVLRTREAYYFSTSKPCSAAMFVNTIGDNKLVLMTMDSHEEVYADEELDSISDTTTSQLMICLR